MCATFHVDEKIIKKYTADLFGDSFPKSGDVYPADSAVILTDKRPQLCKWGFVRNGKHSVIFNARAETVTEKPMFERSFLQARCVVPVRGFYEWSAQKKKLYFSENSNSEIFLCGFFRDDRFVIMTKPSAPPVDKFHSRMPVIVSKIDLNGYLSDFSVATDIITDPHYTIDLKVSQ